MVGSSGASAIRDSDRPNFPLVLTNSLVSYCYRAYGLEVESSSRIEALESVRIESAEPAIRLQQGPEPDWVQQLLRLPEKIIKRRLQPAEDAEPSFVLTELGHGQGFQLSYSDGARFVTNSEGTRVWGAYRPPMAPEEFAVYFLGPVMGFLLRRRHITCLHSSAVEIQGHAICLCGEAGFGKSTTAAALALRGLPVVAEDIVPLCESQHEFLSVPGYPRVCLWPESVQMLLGSEDALPLITTGWEKRFLALDGKRAQFARQKLPLALIYVFGARTSELHSPRIEKLPAREAVLELVKNTYMNWVIGSNQRATEFDFICRLVEQVSVRRVVPNEDPAKINGLCDLILRDAQAFLSSPKSSPETIRQ